MASQTFNSLLQSYFDKIQSLNPNITPNIPGSDTYFKANAVAQVASNVIQETQILANNQFPASSSGTYLDKYAGSLGMKPRFAASSATGAAVGFNLPGKNYAVNTEVIPDGTGFTSPSNNQQYITVGDTNISLGDDLSRTYMSIKSVNTGSGYGLSSGDILNFNTPINITNNAIINDSVYGNSIYAVVGTNGLILTSTDSGATWVSKSTLSQSSAPNFVSIDFGNNYFVLVDAGGYVYYSTDNLNTVTRYGQLPNIALQTVHFEPSNSTWYATGIASGTTSIIYTSTNPQLLWTANTPTGTGVLLNINDLLYTGSTWIIIGGHYVSTTTNLLTGNWTAFTPFGTTSTVTLTNLDYDASNTTCIAVGKTDGVVTPLCYSNDAGATWSSVATYPSGSITNLNAISTDGQGNWVVAGGGTPSGSFIMNATISLSQIGLDNPPTFTASNSPNNLSIFQDVEYISGVWYLLSSNLPYLAISTDRKAWKIKTNNITTQTLSQTLVYFMNSGTDVESDKDLSYRIYTYSTSPRGGGSSGDYINWAIAGSNVVTQATIISTSQYNSNIIYPIILTGTSDYNYYIDGNAINSYSETSFPIYRTIEEADILTVQNYINTVRPVNDSPITTSVATWAISYGSFNINLVLSNGLSLGSMITLANKKQISVINLIAREIRRGIIATPLGGSFVAGKNALIVKDIEDLVMINLGNTPTITGNIASILVNFRLQYVPASGDNVSTSDFIVVPSLASNNVFDANGNIYYVYDFDDSSTNIASSLKFNLGA